MYKLLLQLQKNYNQYNITGIETVCLIIFKYSEVFICPYSTPIPNT